MQQLSQLLLTSQADDCFTSNIHTKCEVKTEGFMSFF